MHPCSPDMFTYLHCEPNTLHGYETSAHSVAQFCIIEGQTFTSLPTQISLLYKCRSLTMKLLILKITACSETCFKYYLTVSGISSFTIANKLHFTYLS